MLMPAEWFFDVFIKERASDIFTELEEGGGDSSWSFSTDVF